MRANCTFMGCLLPLSFGLKSTPSFLGNQVHNGRILGARVRANDREGLLPLFGGDGQDGIVCRAESHSAGRRAEQRSARPKALRPYITAEAHQPGARSTRDFENLVSQ